MLVSELGPVIPHAGAMRLLHEVVRWDDECIECRATSHHDPANPLRQDDRLPALAGLEYGAQAMAIHGALVHASPIRGSPIHAAPIAAAAQPQPAAARPAVDIGMLVAAHDIAWNVARLDDIEGDLSVRATRLLGSARQVVYEFTLSAAGVELVRGRAAVMLSV